jgi:NitT/TauT family transport system ATP-binding protein
MFQEPRLLPWKTVKQNIDLVIRDLYPKQLREEKIAKYLDMVELSDFGDYWPDNLSGGMKQRVGIARAFIYPSQILLMDEPFKGLDLQLKIALLDSFRALWEKDKRSVIFVTHDPDEALYIADEVFVLTELPAKVRKAFTIDLPREQRRYGEKRYTGLEEILLDKPVMQ